MGINRVVISGNLTRDAELRQTQSGMAVLSFGVAVNERVKDQRTGEWEDRANFVDCAMFGSRAQAISQYLHKGLKVAIEGRLRYSSWEDKGGGKRSKIEVVVDEIEFMSAADGAYGQGRPQGGGYRQERPGAPQEGYQPQGGRGQRQGHAFEERRDAGVYDEDLPF